MQLIAMGTLVVFNHREGVGKRKEENIEKVN